MSLKHATLEILLAASFAIFTSAQTPPSIVSISPSGPVLHPIVGDRLEITATATGTPPLLYEWIWGDDPVAFATGSTLIVNQVQSYPASYRVRVSNATGADESAPIRIESLTRNYARFDVITPDFELSPGEPFTLSVDWSGSLPVILEWRKDDEIIQTGGGSSFHVESATLSDAGVYSVQALGPRGTGKAFIHVAPLPEVEVVPQAPVIVAQSDPLLIDLNEPWLNLFATATGSLPMTFEFFTGDQLLATRNISQSTNGEASANYQPQTDLLSSFTTYTIRVSNSIGSTVSSPITVGRKPAQPPQFQFSYNPPRNATLTVGESITWSLTATGTPPLSYSWFKDGKLYRGPSSINRSFSLNSVTFDTAGEWVLTATNTFGSVSSAPARLTVIEETLSPPSATARRRHLVPFKQGDTLRLDYAYLLTGSQPMTYVWHHDGIEVPGETNGWIELTGEPETVIGDYTLIATNDAGSATLPVAQVFAQPGYAPSFFRQPSALVEVVAGQSKLLESFADGSPTAAYQWFKDGNLIPNRTSPAFYVSGSASDAAGVYHVEATNPLGSARSQDVQVSVISPREFTFEQHPASAHLRPGSSTDLRVRLHGNREASVQWFRDGEPLVGSTFLSLRVETGGTYHVEARQDGVTLTSNPAVVTVGDSNPNAPFTYVEGDRYLVYQTESLRTEIDYYEELLSVRTTDVPVSAVWMRDGVPLPDQNDLYLWVDSWDWQPGTYTVAITTAAGSFTSPPMELRWRDGDTPPHIYTQLEPRNFYLGDISTPRRLSVGVNGSGPLHYQWFKDDAPIETEDVPYLEIPAFSASDAGHYFVRVSNPYGFVDSAVARLDHPSLVLPVIYAQPRDIAIPNPAVFNDVLEVAVYPLNQTSFQWYRNDQPVPGATDPVLGIRGYTTDVIGSYRVAVTNDAGTVWSEPAEITHDPVPPTSPPVIITMRSGRHRLGAGTALTLSAFPFKTLDFLAYQWHLNGVAIPGATDFNYMIANVTKDHAGDYTLTASTPAFSYSSPPTTVEVTNDYSPLHARHRIIGNGVFADQPIRIHTRLTHPGDLSAASYSLLLPPGWSLADQTASTTSAAPVPGETDLLEWRWTAPPTSPIDFEFTLTPPASPTGTEELPALLESTRELLDFQALAMPDPLMLQPVPEHHTADTDKNGKLSLSELLRVIELYNTRFGTTRTGRYSLSDTTDDGFAPDASQAASTESTVRRIHLADTDWDGALSLSELLRVIELYNTRSGTTRTGAYHRAAGTPDGFAPES